MDTRHSFSEFFLIVFLLCIDVGFTYIQDEDYFDEPSFNRCPWIRNKLKNGRVRYRYKGRVAKFLCDSGFELAGKRSSTCVRGQWSNPVPVCVARGCSRVPSVSNGRITEMYRGALLVYDCNPGYVLDGNPTIHCDGRRWNTAPPSCAIAAETPETYCDFENPDLCGWSHDPNHDFDWQRNQFSTPSGHVGTGPAFDHTFGENKAGFYLYIEASSPRKINDTARLFSPVYSHDLSGGCFTFWYHMYGATTGGLRVYLKPESHVFDELKPNWEKYGDQGNQWLKGRMIVPVLHENFQIVIEGLRGESYVGDSAIDDVRLTLNLCNNDDNSTDITESVDQYSCRGRCQESGSESSCGCNANCVSEPNFCCRDYHTICTAGNSTSEQNTDEPLPEDYKTSTMTASKLTTSTVQDSEETTAITTAMQTDRQETTSVTEFVSSTALTSTSISLNPDYLTKADIPFTTENHLENKSTEIDTSTATTVLTDTVPSTMLKTEISTTTSVKTTPYISSNTSVLIISTAPASSSETTISSTNPPTTPTTFQTTVSTDKLTTILQTTQDTPETVNTTSSIPLTTLETTTHTIPIDVYENNSTTTTTSSSSTEAASSADITVFSSAATVALSSTVTSQNTEQTSFSTTTLSSTRKTYNLRPRNRTSTTVYTILPFTNTTMVALTTTAPTKSSTPLFTLRTTSRYWYRNSLPSSTKQPSTSTSLESTTRKLLPEKTTVTVVTFQTTHESTKTTEFYEQFTRPTESIVPKTSDFYESNSNTTPSHGSVSVIVSIVILVVICLTAGLVYYMKKHRSKRQSKLSDDSEMRFLPESDYMEYSDASALDRILVK